MNVTSLINKKFLATCVFLITPLFSQAEPPHDGDRGHCLGPGLSPHSGSVHDAVFHDEGMPPMGGMPPPGHGDMPPPGHGDMLGLMHGVTLTEAQDDKIFAIMHAAAPLLREQEKRARHSAEGMHDMALSGQFDEAKLKSLADTNAKAMAEIMLLHARSEHEILVLLTPEQRAQIDAGKAKFEGCQDMKAPTGNMKNKVNAPQ